MTRKVGRPRLPMGERIARWYATKTRPQGECLIWTGSVQRDDEGYVHPKVSGIHPDGTRFQGYTHRVIWQHDHPEHQLTRKDVITQTCGEPLCIRREHLTRTTYQDMADALREATTICRNGHPWDQRNTRNNPNGSRSCRACDREQTAARRATARTRNTTKETTK